MMTPSIIVALTIVLLFSALIFTRFRPSILFSAVVLFFYFLGYIEQSRMLSFGVNQAVITLLLLLVASLALERTRILVWVTKLVFRPTFRMTLARLGLLTSISSAFLNNTAVVASLMAGLTRSQDYAPSRLLLPLSYFAIIGGTLTLIGTSTNLVVNGLLMEQGYSSLQFFDFLPVGLMILLVTGLAVYFCAYRLPDKVVSEGQRGDYFIDAEVQAGSLLIGKTIQQNGLRALDGLFLVDIVRDGQLISPVHPQMVIKDNDKLVFCGDVKHISQLEQFDGLSLFANSNGLLISNLIEVIVSTESSIIGRTLKNTQFRSRFDAAVVAINRNGQKVSGKLGEQVIYAGDKLVLAVGPDFEKHRNVDRNFFIISGLKVKSRLQTWQEVVAIGGFVLMIALAATGIMSLFSGLLVYVAAMVFSKVLTGANIRRRFPFEIWLMIASALCIADVFTTSGLAQQIADMVTNVAGNSDPWVALAVIFFMTMITTEIVTNNAAAALALPIALGVAQTYGVNYLPFVMAVAYGASASFISPFGYQTNLMVMNAGDYRVMDFVKTGWKVSLTYSAVVITMTPLVFPF